MPSPNFTIERLTPVGNQDWDGSSRCQRPSLPVVVPIFVIAWAMLAAFAYADPVVLYSTLSPTDT